MKHVVVNEERCKSCQLCINACPKHILKISSDKMNAQGYRPAEIAEPEQCIGCVFCATVCPDCAISIYEE